MDNQLYCPDEARRSLVRAEGVLNGIDYLEVLDSSAPPGSPPQQTLLVHCFLDVTGLDRRHVRIEGGVRVDDVRVTWAFPADAVPGGLLSAAEQQYLDDTLAQPARVLVVRTDRRGDFSTYTLRLIRSATDPDRPPDGFDLLLSTVDFSFKIDCPSEFDCRQVEECPPPTTQTPYINYLAKDYASFRQLMLDRLAVLMPGWQERNPADLGIMLVEALAYTADYLSYYQDAAATEAYLGTARRRASVRRHARLVDYFMHDGANARTWVSLEVSANLFGTSDNPVLPAGTAFLGLGRSTEATLPPEQMASSLEGAPIVFESLYPLTTLRASRNAIPFYTWRDPGCCLPRGATRATLHGTAAELDLAAGDVLIFEEVLGPDSGRPEDADPAHRHAVRLDAPPVEHVDTSNGETVLEISWYQEDALPFPLCLRTFGAGTDVTQASVARGNVVLADHGLTIAGEALIPDTVPQGRRYRPALRNLGLTHAMPYDDGLRNQPAAAATQLDLRQVIPAVRLSGEFQTWTPQRDLLNSDRFAPEFVVEMEEDGRAYIRFGDDILGRQPAAGTTFQATYRVGNGAAGNIGADSLTRVVSLAPGITRVRNPLPATGGTDPEPVEQVRLYAPQAFRRQERAVTAADYAVAAQRHPEVQRAAASRRWTGSWYTWFVTVDRTRGKAVDADFEAGLRVFLDRYRLAGYDLEIDAPRFVPLEITLTVCVAAGYFAGDVKQALLAAFSNRDLPDGRRGFFHPDNFSFGQTVYLSQIVAAAMQVPGVAWVEATEFQRRERPGTEDLAEGRILFERLEIPRVDNDPNEAENGRIEFDMQGGL